MKRLTIDEKVEIQTRHMKNWLNNGGMVISLRGRIIKIRQFDVKFMNGQKIAHRIKDLETNMQIALQKKSHVGPEINLPKIQKELVELRAQLAKLV